MSLGPLLHAASSRSTSALGLLTRWYFSALAVLEAKSQTKSQQSSLLGPLVGTDLLCRVTTGSLRLSHCSCSGELATNVNAVHLLPGDASLVLGMVGTLATSGAQSVGPETSPRTPTKFSYFLSDSWPVGPFANGPGTESNTSCGAYPWRVYHLHLHRGGESPVTKVTQTGGHPTFLRNDPLGIFVGIFCTWIHPGYPLDQPKYPVKRKVKKQLESWNDNSVVSLSHILILESVNAGKLKALAMIVEPSETCSAQ